MELRMHATIGAAFQNILSGLQVHGRVLEVGAIPSPQSLLNLEALQQTERIGVNIQGNVRFGGFEIIEANGNDMRIFPDEHFDCVLSNATLEHDPYFWKTCSEMKRVLRTGGIAVIGGPGFTAETGVTEMGIPAPWAEDDERSWRHSALTFRFHGAPNDYYRFSPEAFREVIFDGYRGVVIKALMVPPRIIGYGYKSQ
jgi:SAM-dependent methyltransferase